ncbi:hypothetical protein AWC38_SpisGene20795 [Stylophora pistillata]|uniref:Reverse transcriptase zinc-binding domain-containing protein n=1 Tax=Stylophora pistillata TaxID=50429 RepID=A0A2B4RF55_STYPI|nr:hypothetical protein AWC38_SpisGene20795 [Stylophora pistillata]
MGVSGGSQSGRNAHHTIAGLVELYEQFLPTRVYTSQKTHTSGEGEVRCRLCGEAPESVAHILSGCSALTQRKYLSRHDAALKVLFYELLYDEGVIDEIPPWYSPDKPKPVYESENVKAYWDVPIYADQQEVRCNRVDARLVNHMCKRVVTLEMSCPWINNRTRKDEEKTLKYGPLRWELRQQFPSYEVKKYNIIIDALGGGHGSWMSRCASLLEAEAQTVSISCSKMGERDEAENEPLLDSDNDGSGEDDNGGSRSSSDEENENDYIDSGDRDESSDVILAFIDDGEVERPSTTLDDMNDVWDAWKALFMEAVERNIPTNLLKRKRNVPWFNSELRILVLKKRRLWRKEKSSWDPVKWAQYKSFSNKVKDYGWPSPPKIQGCQIDQ